ncbi:MAG: GGDEF domain-containing protein [Coriobacteriia bacterium]
MSLRGCIRSLDGWSRAILIGRAAGAVFLGALWLWADPGPDRQARAVAATVIWIGSSLTMLAIGLWKRERPLTAIVVTAISADCVSLALMNSTFIEAGETAYAWYVTTAVIAAVLFRKRDAWIAGGILAISWMLSYLGDPAEPTFLHISFVVTEASILVLLGAVVSYVTGRQEENQARLELQRAEVSDLNEKLERSVAELRAVTEITELIHSTLEVEDVGPMLLEILEKLIDIPAGSLYVIDKDKQETVFATSSLTGGGPARSYSGLELAGAMPVGSSDGALACIELVDHKDTVVVFCSETAAVEALTRDDRIVLQAVASELVVAVENSRLYGLTKRLAITDELTDLYNYRFLQQRLDEEMGRADRYNKRLSLLMLDLDDFKRINDTHGHIVGDRVLAEVGQLLKSTVREVDIVARYGGEEFTIILPETDASGAFIVAEKIREAVAVHRFPDADGGRSIHLTVSIGLSSYPVHASDKEALLRSADDAVYHAKETGKDRVRAPRLRLRRMPLADGTTGGTVE